MRKIVVASLLLFLFTAPIGCTDMNDNAVPDSLEIKDFVWKGMNLYYLWQADVPDLSDTRFANQGELNTYLTPFASPSDLFKSLLYQQNVIDKFSRITSDYTVLEGVLAGNTLNNGMDYGLRYKSGSSGPVFGWVHYVLPNTDAAAKNVQRGTIFYAVNGTPLYQTATDNNLSLLNATTYTINLADYDNGNITPNGQSITLTKTDVAENPIFINTVITHGTHNIGYLMYNGFYPSYDDQLNTMFGNFAAQNVTDLVLDLRYNSGGSINTAVKLASMITGQFSGQLFASQQWNAKAQAYYLNNNPGSLENRFIGGLNGLHLNKVYVLTTKATASASELVINCLKPYINVVQIGDITTGKNVGSVTLYDSPTFGKSDANPNHKYAMQPIVLKIVNKNGFGDYTSGITPTNLLPENFNNMGVLGSTDEPLFNAAYNLIIASGKMLPQVPSVIERDFSNAKTMIPMGTDMYLNHK
ncbi:S41 family peptidase [Flavobacterium sp. N1994]|uniref:S41 family peptidase n=1 Tax=Flavobacterium sp. N1994 TaxID=2986827 RepID=UPI0022223E5D|nr:S41 family peptidase [Flavobacterium sp. N1994]